MIGNGNFIPIFRNVFYRIEYFYCNFFQGIKKSHKCRTSILKINVNSSYLVKISYFNVLHRFDTNNNHEFSHTVRQ